MPPNSPIHYRRIPGTRRYYDPLNPTDIISERQVQNYRRTLNEGQRTAVRQEARRVATWRNFHEDNLVGPYQRKLASEGRDFDDSAKRDYSELYARLAQISIEEQSMLGLPERRADLERLRSANGEYAQILVELGRRPADADYAVGKSPEGTAGTVYPL